MPCLHTSYIRPLVFSHTKHTYPTGLTHKQGWLLVCCIRNCCTSLSCKYLNRRIPLQPTSIMECQKGFEHDCSYVFRWIGWLPPWAGIYVTGNSSIYQTNNNNNDNNNNNNTPIIIWYLSHSISHSISLCTYFSVSMIFLHPIRKPQWFSQAAASVSSKSIHFPSVQYRVAFEELPPPPKTNMVIENHHF